MASDPWNPTQYERFRDERAAPFHALLEGIPSRPGGTAVDLGAGTAQLTALLHKKARLGLTVAVDSSKAMLDRGREHAGAGLELVQGDLARFTPRRPVDLVVSNAALHWVTGHEALLPRLFGFVAPGGMLAVQVPSNDAHPSHRISREVAGEEPFRAALNGFVRVTPVLAPEGYARVLRDAGAEDVRAETRVFEHTMDAPADVVSWIRGTTLTAYERRMDAELYAEYLRVYEERLLSELPDERPYLYPFQRTFVWATRR